MATKQRKTLNTYQRLVKKKGSFCKGRTTKSEVKKAATAYVKHAVKKAGKDAPAGKKAAAEKKARREAKRSADRVLKGGCKISSVVAGKKKRKAKRK